MPLVKQQNNSDKPLAIALMGPTAAGKTDLAIVLSEALEADIISVDSAMVYRGMDIGTAKPSTAELALAPHRLIDICDPAQAYSVADFCRDAQREMASIIESGRTPLLVGGTMMYFKALLEGLAAMPTSDPDIRQQIEAEAKSHGWPHIHQRLRDVDPVSAARIHPNHSQRLSRALEVYRLSGKPLSQWQAEGGEGLLERFRWRQIAIAPSDRSLLHHRIEERFYAMLEAGFLDEVQELYRRNDLHADLPSMRAVGYRQVWNYLAGECSYDTMVEQGLAATRQLAKRQLTWLRAWKGLNWLETQKDGIKLSIQDETVKKALNFAV